MHCAAFAAAVLAAAASSGPCDKADCAACLEPKGDDGKLACAWCYATQRCVEVRTLQSTLCPAFTREPDVCRCAPGLIEECHDCVTRPGCVWVSKGSLNQTVTLSSTFTIDSHASWERVCWTGGLFQGPSHLSDTYTRDKLSTATSRTADQWSWGQCGMRNKSFGYMIVMLVVGGTVGAGLILRACSTPRNAEQY